MDGSPTDPGLVPLSEAGGPWRRRLRRAGPFLVLGGLVAVVALAVLGGPSSKPIAALASPPPVVSTGPLIAVVDDGGALTTRDPAGDLVGSYGDPDVRFGFPAWSPDGRRLAAVGYGVDDVAIYVFDVPRTGAAAAASGGPGPANPSASVVATRSPGPAARPGVIYASATNPPFYLFWTPDGRQVAFLANDPTGIALRIAPADGSAPLDGSGPGAVIRRGAPLYFDWTAADRLLLHVGTGATAFVGEVGLDGVPAAAPIAGTGADFRTASASRDGRYLAYATGSGTSSAVVVASRDGSVARRLPVFGPAAFAFDPTGDTVASIAETEPVPNAPAFPVGPLRLIDPRSGDVRTLLDGAVAAFFWSPDGRTIAALRLAGSGGLVAGRAPEARFAVARPIGPSPGASDGAASSPQPVGSPIPDASPGSDPSPAAAPTVHLVFLDVATGGVRSDRPVRLGDHFVGELLPYFDQYALSHRLWAPDGSSILLPLVDDAGRSRLTIVPVDGSPGRAIADGVSGFWSP